MDIRSDKNSVPLAVDLDGTLIATDLLWEVVMQSGVASAFSSALVLALYIDSSSVRELYPHPWMVWPLAPTVLYIAMRIWILAHRDELHDNRVVFIVRDWRSQAMVLIGATLIVTAGMV